MSKIREVPIDANELVANISNISQILNENGVKRNDFTKVALTAIIIIEMRLDGLTNEQIMSNFIWTLELMNNFRAIEQKNAQNN